MKIIVGLGNPGIEYDKTRHNCGYMVLNEYTNKFTDFIWKEEKKFNSLIGNTKEIIFVKPLTMMNLSGVAIHKILQYYKIDKKDLIVIYDDIDLPLGTIRVRETGSAGTHNGMKSIINELNSKDFLRIRIGIESRGESSPLQQDLTSFVLSRFSKKEEQILKKSVNKAISELDKLVK